jgi:hypothetical protein
MHPFDGSFVLVLGMKQPDIVSMVSIYYYMSLLKSM